ncbi:hypothetical protein HZH68_004738 [Vespula germanica]|uniref:Uncharacterized protein n=1 Tax=Vespula germanica TaxID=30212 RepID=A0A834NI79_VESGE|nr:hypothetical protein HZH68_004738 [Vespula germanica]
MAGAMACSCKIETDLGDARNGQNPHLWVNTGFRRPLRLSFRGSRPEKRFANYRVIAPPPSPPAEPRTHRITASSLENRDARSALSMSTSMVLPLVPITRISQCAICESSRVPGGPFALWGYHNSPILQNRAGFHLPGISELMKRELDSSRRIQSYESRLQFVARFFLEPHGTWLCHYLDSYEKSKERKKKKRNEEEEEEEKEKEGNTGYNLADYGAPKLPGYESKRRGMGRGTCDDHKGTRPLVAVKEQGTKEKRCGKMDNMEDGD